MEMDEPGDCGRNILRAKDIFEANMLNTIVHWLVIIDNSNNAFLGIQV